MLRFGMDYLKIFADSLIEITEAEWAEVHALYTPEYYKKGELICRAGEVCRHSLYLAGGVARSFGIDAYGKEFTWMAHVNDGHANRHNVFLGDYVSLISGEEGDIFCEALQECTVYKAKYSDIQALYESGIKWMRLAKEAAEGQFLILAKYQRMLKRLNAKDRYMALKSFAPIYEEVLLDYQYASLLDIAPQSLSRIKKELSQ